MYQPAGLRNEHGTRPLAPDPCGSVKADMREEESRSDVGEASVMADQCTLGVCWTSLGMIRKVGSLDFLGGVARSRWRAARSRAILRQ